jgi:hypothetical protein
MFDRSSTREGARCVPRLIGGVTVSTCLVNVEQRAEVSILVKFRENFQLPTLKWHWPLKVLP